MLIALALVAARSRAGEHAETHPPMSSSAGDARQPLPLTAMMADHQKQNMRDHLAAVQAIVAAVGRDDMHGVTTAVGRIGYSEGMGRMCEHMGAAAPGFTDRALDFHRTADGIAEAARRGDRPGVLSALDRTLQACVGCHATYGVRTSSMKRRGGSLRASERPRHRTASRAWPREATEHRPSERRPAATTSAAMSATGAPPTGLGADEAARRLAVHGPNVVPRPPATPQRRGRRASCLPRETARGRFRLRVAERTEGAVAALLPFDELAQPGTPVPANPSPARAVRGSPVPRDRPKTGD